MSTIKVSIPRDRAMKTKFSKCLLLYPECGMLSGLRFKHIGIVHFASKWVVLHIPSGGYSIAKYRYVSEARLAALRFAELLDATEHPLRHLPKPDLAECHAVCLTPFAEGRTL